MLLTCKAEIWDKYEIPELGKGTTQQTFYNFTSFIFEGDYIYFDISIFFARNFYGIERFKFPTKQQIWFWEEYIGKSIPKTYEELTESEKEIARDQIMLPEFETLTMSLVNTSHFLPPKARVRRTPGEERDMIELFWRDSAKINKRWQYDKLFAKLFLETRAIVEKRLPESLWLYADWYPDVFEIEATLYEQDLFLEPVIPAIFALAQDMAEEKRGIIK